MTRIIMSGCSGRMGRVITDIVKADNDAEIVAGIDIVDDGTLGYPVFANPADIDIEADVIIDFSSPKVTAALFDYAVAKQIPVVLCTTGFNEDQLKMIEETEKKIAILKSANMSLGINTIINMLKMG